ncbi:hypothetical protein HJC23_007128 [Cyclotella cryptica]|uniref:WKF domain-containing protein n=1 Tax=Cyclotella cryptica TaxID=29204 RepID=A0ABD3NNS8_9STRA|eukprot:CCRYP_020345-RA/>CCRYP_020345-RA protein AED:0.00 eAED:0.00 QI:88/-1/1/1/-1/1/1/190/225
MGAGKNKAHRKKRISKHVLDADERKKQAQLENELISSAEQDAGGTSADAAINSQPDTKVSTNKKKEKSLSPASKTKDPEEAASYLTLWNQDRKNKSKSTASNGAWKFNKNTQSWLLRHMYDSDKVTKTTYALLIDYICQGGDGTRSRVEEDAKRRAIRYKEWEKKQHDEVVGSGEEKVKEQEKQNKEEEEAWAELSDHDKRKEYKRARKVLDALKEVKEKAVGVA